jgi:hypothetical protein
MAVLDQEPPDQAQSPQPQLLESERHLITEALQTARLLNQQPEDSPSRQRLAARLQQLQTELANLAHPIAHTPLAVEQIPLRVRIAFVEAALLLRYYEQLGGATWQGTLPSLTLKHYDADVDFVGLMVFNLSQLCQQFQLDKVTETHIGEMLTAVDAKLEQHQQIIQAALSSFGLWPVAAQAPATAPQGLFQHLFGQLAMPAAAVAVVFTPTQIYFCLDSEGEQLRDAALWSQLSAAEQHQIATFLREHQTFSFRQFHQFPTFCLCNPAEINPDWVNQLAQTTGYSPNQVCQTLSQSVGLLPTTEAEKFLLHDIWGHNWQAILTQFHGDYRILANCDQPLRAGETAYTPHGPLTCRELFERQGEQVTLNLDHAQLFFAGEVRQRLGVMFTHLLGEMIADVAEFKFLWDYPELSEALPSSSPFKHHPTKLDFAFSDLDFLFLRVLRPLLDLHLSLAEETLLEQELLAEWEASDRLAPSWQLRVSLKQALAQLYQVFFADYRRTCLPTLTEPNSLFADTLGNLIHLQNVINALCMDQQFPNLAGAPLQVVLMLFLGVYCSGDSYDDFWDVDNAIAEFFMPAYLHLETFVKMKGETC